MVANAWRTTVVSAGVRMIGFGRAAADSPLGRGWCEVPGLGLVLTGNRGEGGLRAWTNAPAAAPAVRIERDSTRVAWLVPPLRLTQPYPGNGRDRWAGVGRDV